jgi:hypothetical protein
MATKKEQQNSVPRKNYYGKQFKLRKEGTKY